MACMKRLLVGLVASLMLTVAPAGLAAATSPTVRLTIVHVVHGCHSWGTALSQALTPRKAITVRRGTVLLIRVNCPMDFRFRQTAGPRLELGDRLTHSGTVRRVVFKKAGLYRLRATSTETSEQAGLQTLGPDNVLTLTVRVR